MDFNEIRFILEGMIVILLGLLFNLSHNIALILKYIPPPEAFPILKPQIYLNTHKHSHTNNYKLKIKNKWKIHINLQCLLSRLVE